MMPTRKRSRTPRRDTRRGTSCPRTNKWFTRVVVAAAVISALDSLELAYPEVGKEQQAELAAAKQALLGDK